MMNPSAAQSLVESIIEFLSFWFAMLVGVPLVIAVFGFAAWCALQGLRDLVLCWLGIDDDEEFEDANSGRPPTF